MKEKLKNSDIVLSVNNICKTYPGVIALNNVSIEFKRSEIHALMGENGAGKSTLIKVIAGSVTPDDGTFTIDGRTYHKITPKQAKQEGIEIVYQELNLVPDISVAENVFLGDYIGNGVIINKDAMKRETGKIFKELGIEIDPEITAKQLSTAQMQFVEIARAVRKDVKVLVMDEPTAPLTVKDVEILFQLIRKLKNRGVTIIYISHRLNEIYQLSDRLTVMRDGQVIGTADTSEIKEAQLIKMMVGRELNETYPPRKYCRREEVVLKVKRLCGNGVENISFQLYKGEILGIAGLVGSGRTETARMIFGADPKKSGEICYDGKAVDISSPQKAVELGIGFLPEDRKLHGVLLNLSIWENMVLPALKRLSRGLILQNEKEKQLVEKYMDVLRIKAPSCRQLTKNLSGGNQQKVVMGKWLASGCQVLIFDEPTRGIDVGAKYEIYQLMNQLTEQGTSIIMISSEMEELLGMADRILVFHEGHITGTLNRSGEFTQEKIMEYASKP